MNRVLSMLLDAAIAAVVLIPLFLLLNKCYFHNTKRSTLYFLFSVYLCGMFAVVGLPDICYIRFDPNFNFTLFAYMFSDAINSLLNVALFLPMGFCLPLLWKAFAPLRKTLLFGFGVSLFIEILQIFTFRASDVNDLITNSAGTILGWCFARILMWAFPGLCPEDNRNDVSVVCLSAFGIMFFLQPFPANYFFRLLQ